MPFRQSFEEHVNANMATTSTQASSSKHDEAIAASLQDTKGRPSNAYASGKASDEEAVDMDLHHKKDTPPRFSTLFTQAPPAPSPVPAPQPVYIDSYPTQKRSGIHLSTPMFALLMFVLFFESTLLFAYTVIGLYGNMPQPLLALAGMSGNDLTVNACENGAEKSAINFAPNFYLDGEHKQVEEAAPVTVTKDGPSGYAGTATPTTTSTASTSSIPDSSYSAGVSNILAMLRPSSSNGVVTVTAPAVSTKIFSEVAPEKSTVSSVKFVTITEASSSSTEPVRSTITSMVGASTSGV